MSQAEVDEVYERAFWKIRQVFEAEVEKYPNQFEQIQEAVAAAKDMLYVRAEGIAQKVVKGEATKRDLELALAGWFLEIEGNFRKLEEVGGIDEAGLEDVPI